MRGFGWRATDAKAGAVCAEPPHPFASLPGRVPRPPDELPMTRFIALVRTAHVQRAAVRTPMVRPQTVRALQLATPTGRALMLRPAAHVAQAPQRMRDVTVFVEPTPGMPSAAQWFGTQLYNWWTGQKPPSQPPQLVCRIQWPEPDEKDPRGCIAAFFLAAAHIVKNATDDAAERRKKELEQGKKDSPVVSEDERVGALRDMNSAVQDYEACLKGKGTASKDLMDGLVKEARSEVQRQVQSQFNNWAAGLQQAQGRSEAMVSKTAQSVLELQKQLEASIQALVMDLEEGYNRGVRQAFSEYQLKTRSILDAFSGATREYMAVIDLSDGKTSVTPSIVKSIEKYAETGEDSYSREVKSGLEKQLESVTRANPNNPDLRRFVEGMRELISNC
mgnify:CR=1 FL=1